jgi:hypothetical protein
MWPSFLEIKTYIYGKYKCSKYYYNIKLSVFHNDKYSTNAFGYSTNLPDTCIHPLPALYSRRLAQYLVADISNNSMISFPCNSIVSIELANGCELTRSLYVISARLLYNKCNVKVIVILYFQNKIKIMFGLVYC